MTEQKHRWLGRWKLQRCAYCGALRRRLPGETQASEFLKDAKTGWDQNPATIFLVHRLGV